METATQRASAMRSGMAPGRHHDLADLVSNVSSNVNSAPSTRIILLRQTVRLHAPLVQLGDDG
ncbi:hypothetical protein J8I87_36730 [Paraburkholderia sp. LEh10]|uniref:hypothetical protein n=1 Tax=Paraburkholderia sp. LEh10 TaxID=2821353 RepID=UPI001AEA7A67|nr:hypothetical protein [Paraburkholderia sp. LEh10]MBP0595109.1 hypothetical protein [Paraburkholderia sp. LEh10]